MSELKKCPFCGGEPEVVLRPDNLWGGYFCNVFCGCGGHLAKAHKSASGADESEVYNKAITAWNRRSDDWHDGTPPELGDTDQLIVIEYPAPISKAPLYAVLRWRDGNYSDTRYQIATHWKPLPEPPEGE